MFNSPSESDNTIGQILIEDELGQATPQYNLKRRIASGNIVVGQGQYQYLTPPTEVNWHNNNNNKIHLYYLEYWACCSYVRKWFI